ncbi:hypothetical protein D1J63_13360 [Streptomyces sp. KPB2]|nr:hypothetical protein D1J63_13360 [Streptomyces sp. KPB2]
MKGKPGTCPVRARGNGVSAAVRDPARNPHGAAGEATQIGVGVHPPIASCR